MSRSLLPGILAMAIVVVASNILVQFLFGQWLTWGAFTYPLAFFVNEVVNRLRGLRAARTVVFWGFVTGILCSFIGTQIEGEFGPLVSFRVALASAVAFAVGQMLDATIFDRMRHQAWWRPPFISSLVASSIDTVLFFSLAFSAALSFIHPANDVAWANEMLPMLGVGPVLPLWISLATADWLVKVALSLIVLMPFRALVRKLSAASA
jgi:queuosine precursor transporter